MLADIAKYCEDEQIGPLLDQVDYELETGGLNEQVEKLLSLLFNLFRTKGTLISMAVQTSCAYFYQTDRGRLS